MIARRSFMALLGLAPIAGVQAASQSFPPAPIGTVESVAEVEDRLRTAAHRFLRKEEERINSKLCESTMSMPVSVSGKKSWSPAFKVHVCNQIRAHHSPSDFWEMDRDELIAFAVKRGFSQ